MSAGGGIAFLGAGNMAAAMVEGLLARGAAGPGAIACLAGSGPSAPALAARTGIRLASSIEDLLAGATALVVAFKPQHLGAADPRLAGLTRGMLVVSVLAGRRLEALSAAFPGARNIVRLMPNTPSRIGAGMTGWCALRPPEGADAALLASLLGALGRSVQVPEERMDALTAVSGSGPAYVFEFAAALREAGVAAGLDPETARTLATETLLGAARLLAESGTEPEVLRNQVTSPNGTTAAGLAVLARSGFRSLVRDTVAAAKARSEELSR